MSKRTSYPGIVALGVAAVLSAWLPKMHAGGGAAAVSVGSTDIGGVVTSAKGPEAGVWVIAETSDLPTKYVKIVVTDDRAATWCPNCPRPITKSGCAATAWWIPRRCRPRPAKTSNLTAKLAPDARAAAQYYPADYWYSLLKLPAKSDFPGTGPSGNGISPNVKSQGQWIEW